MYQLRGVKILPIVLPSIVEAQKFSDHPRIPVQAWRGPEGCFEKVEVPRIARQSASEAGKAVKPKHGFI
jgi:hypothetical protein